jgi:hypothetical protein
MLQKPVADKALDYFLPPVLADRGLIKCRRRRQRRVGFVVNADNNFLFYLGKPFHRLMSVFCAGLTVVRGGSLPGLTAARLRLTALLHMHLISSPRMIALVSLTTNRLSNDASDLSR